jgi:hypothetical protein
MGVASLRRERGGLSGHTLKGSQSPGEAEVAISRCGRSVGTENLRSLASRWAEEDSPKPNKGDTSGVLNLWRTG